MRNYLVQWKIEIQGETPEDAAVNAFNAMSDPDTPATIFDVTPLNKSGKPVGKLRRIDVFEAAGGQR